MLLPTARREKLTVQELPEETLVYDLVAAKAHCLNRTAALVWKRCDGHTASAELAAVLGRELGKPVPEAVIELAVEQLARRSLLETPVAAASEAARRSRRDVLRKFAGVAAALPVVMTLMVPAASAQVSPRQCVSNGDCASLNGNNGCLVGVCVNGACVRQNAANGTPCTNLAIQCPVQTVCQNGSCLCPVS